MRAGTFLLYLPICITMLHIQGQPLIDDPLMLDEDNCVLMTDTRASEINDIIEELSDFVNVLAEKHGYFDLKLVKIDVEKRNEADTEETTVLELYVNNCGTDTTNGDFNELNDFSEIKSTNHTVSKDIDALDIMNTLIDTKETNSASQDINESVSNELNVKKSESKISTKIITKDTAKEEGTTVKDDMLLLK